MKEGLFFLFLFNFIPISAQYCCTEIGKVLHYTTIDKKQEKTLKDSALVSAYSGGYPFSISGDIRSVPS